MTKQTAFIISAFFVSVVFATPHVVMAVTTTTTTETKTTVTSSDSMKSTESANTTVTEKVDYAMPYPGILPDHPLYFLKTLRDSILQLLIGDPVRKVEFNILQADKKLMMGLLLIDKGKNELGSQYLGMAETSMQSAVDGFSLLKSQGKEVPGYVADKLNNAMTKHMELLEELMTKSKDVSVAKALELLNKLETAVAKLK